MDAVAAPSALVVGVGSIGTRHLRNLRAAGVERLSACDPDPQRQEVAHQLGAGFRPSLDGALRDFRPDLALICSPPRFHVEQAVSAVRAGCHVLIEKPLSDRLDGIDELQTEARARKRVVQVGYNLRFHPGLREVERVLRTGAVGRVWWIQVEAAQYLPDWRPQQDYRRGYTARRELGGGIILDGSHELHYLHWLFGEPEELVCMGGRVSDLDVDVEDCATILLRYPGGAQACIHLDFVQRAYARALKVAGSAGVVTWEYTTNRVKRFDAATRAWDEWGEPVDPNEMYRSELAHFLSCAASGTEPLVGVDQAAAVLRVALAAREAMAKPGLRVTR
jgi:predicted dehydrogenase